ncbi:DUF6571 family protein [Streptomyces qinglanensis]|uniref:DUF6571 domain-containing protein n=1 Tax=Streptomyces qinglanensis TaxID=943816 RepID=A0A1H9NPG0_9ACTN|nr:DUF6571 family protein [Streptomyces qinglanensis]SER37846.1 hypothetical protein SAMN05421870_101559 [Streptomyces qinglanensis]
MELTYHDVMNADFSALSETAKNWRAMGKRCGTLRDNYRDHVRGKLKGWSGEAADAFWKSSRTTLHELSAAKHQAKKIADLLDDSHSRLTEAREHLKKVRDQAVKDGGMKVDAYGKCNLDTSEMTEEEAQSALRDPGRAGEETKWNHRIQKAVKHVDDVDYDNMKALKAAARDKDGKGESGGFNGKAVGDVEKYAAHRASDLAARLDSTKEGGGLSRQERHELQVMLRENADDKQFSRTMLNSLGPRGLIDVTNQMNALAYRAGGTSPARSQYLGMEKTLADTLATATKVPVFRDGNGKKIKLSSPEYGKKYTAWLHSKDGHFYDEWRERMRKAGAEKWTIENKEPGGIGGTATYGRGYQSLLTLMKHGDGYSPQMLYDLGDDLRSAEDKDPNIWDHMGFGKKGSDGGPPEMASKHFENDPYDGLLKIMSKDPDVAAGYLDPASDADLTDEKVEKNDRLEYLLKDRDWKIVDTGAHDITDVVDKDARDGLEAALRAGATGRLPDAASPTFLPKHSEANAGVMEEIVRVLGKPAEGGEEHLLSKDGDLADMRGALGEIVADYPADVQRNVTGDDEYKTNGATAHFGVEDLEGFLNKLGREPHAYGAIQTSQQMYSLDHLRDVLGEMKPGVDRGTAENLAGDAVAGAAHVSGILSEAKADALFEDKIGDDREFNEKADKASKWVNRVISLGTGSFLSEGPAAQLSTPVGWAQADANEAIMKLIKKDIPREVHVTEDETRYQYVDSQTNMRDFARDWAVQYGKEVGLEGDILAGVKDGARREALDAFQRGSHSAGQHGSVPPSQ